MINKKQSLYLGVSLSSNRAMEVSTTNNEHDEHGDPLTKTGHFEQATYQLAKRSACHVATIRRETRHGAMVKISRMSGNIPLR